MCFRWMHALHAISNLLVIVQVVVIVIIVQDIMRKGNIDSIRTMSRLVISTE